MEEEEEEEQKWLVRELMREMVAMTSPPIRSPLES